MRQDAWRAYLELALGATEASRQKATKAVRQVLGKGGATAEQLSELAEELLKTSIANREAVTKLVRYELDRALGRVGLATAEEVEKLTKRVRQLEVELREAQEAAGMTAAASAAPAAGAERAAPAPAKRVVKKAVRPASAPKAATSSTVDSASTGKVTAKKAPAKKAADAPARKPAQAPAKKAAAKKTTAKKAAAKKVSPAAARRAAVEKVVLDSAVPAQANRTGGNGNARRTDDGRASGGNGGSS